jgi:hypothetical protein
MWKSPLADNQNIIVRISGRLAYVTVMRKLAVEFRIPLALNFFLMTHDVHEDQKINYIPHSNALGVCKSRMEEFIFYCFKFFLTVNFEDRVRPHTLHFRGLGMRHAVLIVSDALLDGTVIVEIIQRILKIIE